MPEKKSKLDKTPKIDSLRYAEYYNLQNKFDDLYARSKNGEEFTKLMDLILERENILLAYRNLKINRDSYSPGIDKLTINDIGKLSPEEVVNRVKDLFIGKKKIGYLPKPIRKRQLFKHDGSTRPLGTSCIWDKLIQQCIKQILEPICEAKFSNNSYGFRPGRSVEHTIARMYQLLQRSNLHYVVEVNIKSFFDEVNHVKLIHQLWALGIRDTSLIFRIKSILKTPIKMPNGEMTNPTKGIFQCGILSSLFANIVLNELDHWIEGQWQENPVIYKYAIGQHENGSPHKSVGYSAMKKRTNLKEMYIVRYMDDFRIFCRTRDQAKKTMFAVIQWLKERLRLEVISEKTRIVNTKKVSLNF